MAETLYGTTPCPQVLYATVDDGGNTVQHTCPQAAQVYDLDGGPLENLRSECPDTHVHFFGAYYLPNVTPNP
jgi:hypothetical protein